MKRAETCSCSLCNKLYTYLYNHIVVLDKYIQCSLTWNRKLAKFQYVFLLLFYSFAVSRRYVQSNPDIAPPCTAPTALTAHKSLCSISIYRHQLQWTNTGVTSDFDCPQHLNHRLSLTRDPVFTFGLRFPLWMQCTDRLLARHVFSDCFHHLFRNGARVPLGHAGGR